MQISRHWRIKSQRYRLEGVRYDNGELSLQNRPAPAAEVQRKNEQKQAASTAPVTSAQR